jgi:hypothetical protein
MKNILFIENKIIEILIGEGLNKLTFIFFGIKI